MFKFLKRDRGEQRDRGSFVTMLVFGIIALIASFTLAVEEFALLKNPDAVLSCSLNPVLNCASVMKTWQASAFGFPNMFLGLMGFAIVITVAVAWLAGGRFKRWFWIAATIGYGLGAVFAYWLFFNSVYVIEILCPWCLVVTLSTTLIFASLLHYVLRNNVFGLKKRAAKAVERFIDKGYDKLIVAAWLVLLVSLVFLKFGDSLFGA